MDDVDAIIDRARREAGPGAGDRDLHLLAPVVEALNRGGLAYAMDHFGPAVFDRAADASHRFGTDDLGRILTSAAEIARTHRGLDLDRAITAFDESNHPAVLVEALRAAVLARRQRDAAAFEAVRPS